jgi:hypothetical protein
MSIILSVAERAVLVVDNFLNRAVLFAWTSTLRRHVDVNDGFGDQNARS